MAVPTWRKKMTRQFFEPVEMEEALRLMREHGDSAAFLAGGTALNAGGMAMDCYIEKNGKSENGGFSARPETLISLDKLDFGKICAEEHAWFFPATCTIQDIVDTEGIPPLLLKACRNIVNRNIRNMATLGGHIACNKSCSDIIPALVALDAGLSVSRIDDGSPLNISCMDYVRSGYLPVLIHRITVPAQKGRKFALCNYVRSNNDMSILTVAISFGITEGMLDNPVIAVGGVAKHVVRINSLEIILDGKPPPSVDYVEEQIRAVVSPITDLRGSAEFKRYLAGVLVGRALQMAFNDVFEESGAASGAETVVRGTGESSSEEEGAS